ncbi:hypothetical protein PVAND_004411 [Polypedilum vanderplanki]|uniref:Kinesin-like protein n=1 Tax=Polypedilum vanderplanki TaxID=319348 RepID=A0A9J6BXM6_POLVA|nr:hypothetical protein PVAND_004411 [Polypedilum vanderplanki]
MSSDNIKVSIKVRPLISREKNENCSKEWLIDENGSLSSVSRGHVFNFDHIFDEGSSNADVFEVIAKPIVENALNGINGTIFAYGQTSSGKTYCLSGGENDPGIVILVVNEIFKQINTSEMANREFLIRVGYIEIYNEKIYDLLDAKKTAIEKMFENQGEVKISQIEVMASSSDVMLEHFRRGNELKRTGETAMNERSSRSHSIFSITIESREKGSSGGECKVSTLNLVDLAGSERADQTKATGERLNESKHINQSLLALGKVIRELSSGTGDNGEKFISYRDSKLTRLLSASLGGNAKTAIICTITPATIDETLSTLNFANNAKTIKNKPKVNNIISERTMIAKLQNEILKLHHQLQEEKTKNSKLENINKIKNSIDERERQIIHGFNSNSNKINEMNRRRTWCPSTKEGCKENIFITSTPPSQLPPPPVILRNTEDGPQITFSFQSENLDELFRPADEVNFDEPIPNSQMTDEELARRIRTPKVFKKSVQLPDSPEIKLTSDMIKEEEIIKLKQMNEYLQNELQELQDFKRLEEFCDNDIKNQALFDKINQHEGTIVSLNALIDKQNSEMKELEVRFQLSENEQKKCVKERQEKENLLASIQYEYEQFKQKSKLREEELVNELNKSRNETVNNDLEKLRSEFETTSDQLMDALEDNEKLQQEISDIRDVLSEKVLKIQELQEKIDQHEKIDCQYKKIEEILKNNQEVVQVDETDDLIEMITKLIDAAVKTESLETEKSQFIKEIEEIQIQEKSQIIEKHEQEKLKLINDLENTNALKTSISLELETIKNNQSTAITEYQAQLDKLQTNLEDRLLELSNLEAKYQHITKENKDLIGKVTSLNDFIDKQKSEMKELEMLNQLSENEQKKSIKEIQEKEKLLASIEQDYEQFRQNSKLREEELVNELNKSRNQTVNNDVEKLRSEFETISDQLINSLEDNAKLQQEFNEKVLKIQELQEKIDQHEKK